MIHRPRVFGSLLLGATIAAAQGASPPPLQVIPADLPIARIAAQMAGMVQVHITERQLATDGSGGFIKVRVFGTSIGAARREDELSLRVDPKEPASWIEKEESRNAPYVVYDSQDRLLLVCNVWEPWLMRVLATSRWPSRRFTGEELAGVWRAVSANPEGDLFSRQWHEPEETSAGALELVLRFGSANRKQEALARLRDRVLTKAEVDALLVSLWDLDQAIQAAAAHMILDAGGEIDRQRLRQSLELVDPRAASPVLGPLLRLGDSVAKDRITFLVQTALDTLILHKGPLLGVDNFNLLLELAAWGPKDLIPLIQKFLPGVPNVTSPGTGLYPYLKLGASITFLEKAPIDSQTAFQWEQILLADIPREPEILANHGRPKIQQEPWSWFRMASLGIRNPVLAKRFLTAVGPPSAKVRETFPGQALMLAAACGHGPSIDELLKLDWEKHDVDAITRPAGVALATSEDPRIVDVLVAALVAARTKPVDEACLMPPLSSRATAAIARMLRARSEADQKRALRLLDAAEQVDPHVHHVLVRAALGEPPPAEAIPKLEDSYFTEVCQVSLAPWSDRYASILPVLRADPRKHWFPLALLRDEAVVPELERWLREVVADPHTSFWTGVRQAPLALRMIGGKEALEAFYAVAQTALDSDNPMAQAMRAEILQSITTLERPEAWKRVAALQAQDVHRRREVLAAAATVLAKKP